MADFRSAIKSLIVAQTAITTLMYGGVYSELDLDRRGITLTTVPKEVDGVRVKPFIVIRVRASSHAKPHYMGKLTLVEIYFYQDLKYDKIDSAKRLVKDLLHRATLSATDNETFGYMEWVGDIGEDVEEDLGTTPMSMSRFTILSRDK